MASKGIGSKGRIKLAKVIEAAKGVITPLVAAEALEVPRQEAGRLLSRWRKNGWLARVKRGVYIPVSLQDTSAEFAIEEPWLVVFRLYSPGYIGGFSAIKHWDLSEQIFETVSFFTTKVVSNRTPTIGNVKCKLKTINKKKNFGTKAVWIDSTKVLVSDPSKTLADCFDDPASAGGMGFIRDVFEDYLSSEFRDLPKIVLYAERMGNRTILKRLGFLMESMGLDKEIESLGIRDRLSKGLSLFDPTVTNDAVVSHWSLKVPRTWRAKGD